MDSGGDISAESQLRFWNTDLASTEWKHRKWRQNESHSSGQIRKDSGPLLASRLCPGICCSAAGSRGEEWQGMMKDRGNANRFSLLIRKNQYGRRHLSPRTRLPASPHFLPSPLPPSGCDALPPSRSQPRWKPACIHSILNAAACFPSSPGSRFPAPAGFSFHLMGGPSRCWRCLHRWHLVLAGVGGGGGLEKVGCRRGVPPALDLKPPLSGKNVSSTDKILNDNSFSFCGPELLNISFLSPAPSPAILILQEGLPRELPKRSVPATREGPQALFAGADRGRRLRQCLNAALCWAAAPRAAPGAGTRGHRAVKWRGSPLREGRWR